MTSTQPPIQEGTGSFPGVKRPGRGVDHTSTSSAKIKERVTLYLYATCGLAWPILGRTLLYLLSLLRLSVLSCSSWPSAGTLKIISLQIHSFSGSSELLAENNILTRSGKRFWTHQIRFDKHSDHIHNARNQSIQIRCDAILSISVSLISPRNGQTAEFNLLSFFEVYVRYKVAFTAI
jgi:hypothetical protein